MVDGEAKHSTMKTPGKEVLALIPARGGSKSIPRKNIRLLAGYPLIAYSVAAGLAATSISRVVVSTDDEEIALISRSYGAEVPFIRPLEFAQDQTPDLPVFLHALNWLQENENYCPEIVVQLRPTSPFRNVAFIDKAVNLLLIHPVADSARSVCIPFQNPFKMWTIRPDGTLRPLIPDLALIGLSNGQPGNQVEIYNQPRQALPEVYWQTGYVDAVRSKTILQKKSMTGDCILPVIMDPSDWVDIDTPVDWRRAERMVESGEIDLQSMGILPRKVTS
jgi:N-acylneuraminate cytidylyltransferase